MKTQNSQKTNRKKWSNHVAMLAIALSLSACGNVTERLANVGKAPDFSPIEDHMANSKPISFPLPPARAEEVPQANALWKSDRKGFFEDQRANKIGDILTVIVSLKDEAEIRNDTTRSRNNSERSGIDNLLGFEDSVSKYLPEGFVPETAVGFSGNTNNRGTGRVQREEEIKARVAAVIHDVLPNGNLVIYGRQEIRVNFDVRELYIAGVIRPEDIAPDNSVRHDQIAEARIAYGGRGQLMDVQQPRYGQQIFDIIYPF